MLCWAVLYWIRIECINHRSKARANAQSHHMKHVPHSDFNHECKFFRHQGFLCAGFFLLARAHLAVYFGKVFFSPRTLFYTSIVLQIHPEMRDFSGVFLSSNPVTHRWNVRIFQNQWQPAATCSAANRFRFFCHWCADLVDFFFVWFAWGITIA